MFQEKKLDSFHVLNPTSTFGVESWSCPVTTMTNETNLYTSLQPRSVGRPAAATDGCENLKATKKKREKSTPPTKVIRSLSSWLFIGKNMDGLWDLGQQLHETEHATVQLGLEADRNLGWLQYKAVSVLKEAKLPYKSRVLSQTTSNGMPKQEVGQSYKTPFDKKYVAAFGSSNFAVSGSLGNSRNSKAVRQRCVRSRPHR